MSKRNRAVREAARAARQLQQSGCSAQQEAQLRELWAQLPGVDCQGLCHDSCTAIRMSGPERVLIQRRHGVTIPDRDIRDGFVRCEALTMFNRCGVYEDRPTVCRLWGVGQGRLSCSYGCEPEREVSEQEAYLLLARVWEIAGDVQAAEAVRRAYATPEAAERTQRLLEWGRQRFDEEVAVRNRLWGRG